jgi:hypothetical protein
VVELASRLPGKYTFACVWLEGSHTFLWFRVLAYRTQPTVLGLLCVLPFSSLWRPPRLRDTFFWTATPNSQPNLTPGNPNLQGPPHPPPAPRRRLSPSETDPIAPRSWQAPVSWSLRRQCIGCPVILARPSRRLRTRPPR